MSKARRSQKDNAYLVAYSRILFRLGVNRQAMDFLSQTVGICSPYSTLSDHFTATAQNQTEMLEELNKLKVSFDLLIAAVRKALPVGSG